MSENSTTIVEVESHVIFKIIQHLSDVPNSDIPSCTGAIVGLPGESLIKVTECFPYPFSANQNYNEEMLVSLLEEGKENLLVGFYTATLLESFLSDDFITTLHMYQRTTRESIVIVFDYISIFLGNLSIKAYRLNDSVMDLISQKSFVASSFSAKKISMLNLLQELPVEIRVSPLTKILLAKIKLNTNFKQPLDYLNSSQGSLTDKNFNLLLASLDDLIQNSNATHGHCRKLLRHYSTLEQLKSQTNEQRISKGEDPVPEDYWIKSYNNISPLNRFSFLINSWNANYLNDQINSDISSMMETLLISKELVKFIYESKTVPSNN